MFGWFSGGGGWLYLIIFFIALAVIWALFFQTGTTT
jgi:hypothetical protein